MVILAKLLQIMQKLSVTVKKPEFFLPNYNTILLQQHGKDYVHHSAMRRMSSLKQIKTQLLESSLISHPSTSKIKKLSVRREKGIIWGTFSLSNECIFQLHLEASFGFGAVLEERRHCIMCRKLFNKVML